MRFRWCFSPEDLKALCQPGTAGAAAGKYCSCFTALGGSQERDVSGAQTSHPKCRLQHLIPVSFLLRPPPSPNKACMQVRNMGRSLRNQSFFLSAFPEPQSRCRAACPQGRAVVAGSPLTASSRYEQFLTPSKGPARGSPPSQPPDLAFGVGGPPSRADQGALGGIFWTSLPAETLFLTTSTPGVLWPKAERLI